MDNNNNNNNNNISSLSQLNDLELSEQEYYSERRAQIDVLIEANDLKKAKEEQEELDRLIKYGAPYFFNTKNKYYFFTNCEPKAKIEYFQIGDTITVFYLNENDLEMQDFTGQVVNLRVKKKNSINFKIFLLDDVYLTFDSDSPFLCGVVLVKYGNNRKIKIR
jgi:hypothetical protein